MQTIWDYQLADDNGISTAENVPMLLPIGTIFKHEYGTYKVELYQHIGNDAIDVYCERISK